MVLNRKDAAASLFFIGVGLLYGSITLAKLPIGQVTEMGPGFFPIVLSSVLILLGGIGLLKSLSSGPGTPFGKVAWRPVITLTAGIVFFGAVLSGLGMLLTVFGTAVISAAASPALKAKSAVLIGLGISVFCVLVFILALRLPIPVIGAWIGN